MFSSSSWLKLWKNFIQHVAMAYGIVLVNMLGGINFWDKCNESMLYGRR